MEEKNAHNRNLAAKLLHYIDDLLYYEYWWQFAVLIVTELV